MSEVGPMKLSSHARKIGNGPISDTRQKITALLRTFSNRCFTRENLLYCQFCVTKLDFAHLATWQSCHNDVIRNLETFGGVFPSTVKR